MNKQHSRCFRVWDKTHKLYLDRIHRYFIDTEGKVYERIGTGDDSLIRIAYRPNLVAEFINNDWN